MAPNSNILSLFASMTAKRGTHTPWSDNCGTMWWSIFIHGQKEDGFYDVSEVRTCWDWAIYINLIDFVLIGDAYQDCFTSST